MGIPLEGSLPGEAFQTGKSLVAGSLDLAGLDPTVQHAAVGEGICLRDPCGRVAHLDGAVLVGQTEP